MSGGGGIDAVVIAAKAFEQLKAFRNAGAIQHTVECLLNFLNIAGAALDDILNDRSVGLGHL